MMAWVAVDRAVKAIEEFNLSGDLERWRGLRQQIFDDVCAHAFNPKVGAFTQYYGSNMLDASVLMMPLVGFLPPNDPRVKSTVQAIHRDLMIDGFVYRYHPTESSSVDGLPPGEGAFLPCTFWLADCLQLIGEHDAARRIFERLLTLRNGLGLISEEYDPKAKRLVGNFPQAFSHVALVNTIHNLTPNGGGPAKKRGSTRRPNGDVARKGSE
jgi:GH15 family glucan-1,4-alpha-glucosidase